MSDKRPRSPTGGASALPPMTTGGVNFAPAAPGLFNAAATAAAAPVQDSWDSFFDKIDDKKDAYAQLDVELSAPPTAVPASATTAAAPAPPAASKRRLEAPPLHQNGSQIPAPPAAAPGMATTSTAVVAVTEVTEATGDDDAQVAVSSSVAPAAEVSTTAPPVPAAAAGDGYAMMNENAADGSSDDDDAFDPSALLDFASKCQDRYSKGAVGMTTALGTKAVDDAGNPLVESGERPSDAAVLDFDDIVAAPALAKNNNAARIRELKPFSHAGYEYPTLKKDFFIPPDELKKMTPAEIQQLRHELDGAKVWGDKVPPPIKTWSGIGLNEEVMQVLHHKKFDTPFAVQSVTIPILMSGRDLLAIAKTGSGKTLSYLLPLLRHVHFQRRCGPNEGPTGLILVPTHELAAQIYTIATEFGKVCRMKVIPAYGGTSLHENIRAVRKGSDIMIATPGRLFDLLVANRGHVMALRQTSFVVLDEADRLFDDGFGAHVAAFLQQIRPDRQIALVSSTMPKEVKAAAKKFLAPDFVEVSVGGRPSPSTNVKQVIEIFPAPTDEEAKEIAMNPAAAPKDPRFLRLLQILGDEFASFKKNEAGKTVGKVIIVFVGSKDLCDTLFSKLTQAGYNNHVGVLYSGMDQMDREISLRRFTVSDRPVLIATGVAERGLDVEDLDLVVNYNTPDHYEAYINRIGRTGRAGKRGKAITFFKEGEDDLMAADLVTALEESQMDVPEELYTIAAQMREKVKNGLIPRGMTFKRGYRNARGYSFAKKEQNREIREAYKTAGLEKYLTDSENDDEKELDLGSDDEGKDTRRRKNDPKIYTTDERGQRLDGGDPSNAIRKAGIVSLFAGGSGDAATGQRSVADRVAAALAQANALTAEAEKDAIDDPTSMRQADFEINDYGDRLRKKLVNRRFLDDLASATETSITTKGQYIARRGGLKQAPRGDWEKPLFLRIRGKDEPSITRVFRRLEEIIEDEVERASKLGVFARS